MTNSRFCTNSNPTSFQQRKQAYRYRKLEMLKFIHDKLERRMAALQGSISKLEEQIERNKSDEIDTDNSTTN